MPAPLIASIAAPVVGGLVGKALGPKQQQATAAVPNDLQGMRGNQINLLNYLTGGGMNFGQGGGQGPGVGGGGVMGDRLNQYFGPLSASQNPLQNQAANAASRMLTQQSPVQRTAQFGQPQPQGPQVQPQAPGLNFGGQGGGGGGVPLTQGQGGLPSWIDPNAVAANPAGFAKWQQGYAAQQGGGGMGGPQGGMMGARPEMSMPDSFGMGGPTTPGGFGQQMEQGGLLPGSVQNFYNNLLTNGPGNLGPSSDVQNLLMGIGQNGGQNPQMQQIMQHLMNIGGGQGGGGGGGDNGAGGAASSGAQGFLQKLLAQNPGQTNMDLLQPSFERNLSMANQQGGRFGSANALMRSNAVTDQQAQLAQMLQAGTGQQLQGAGLLGQMGSAAGAQAAGARSNAIAQQLQALGMAGGFAQQGVNNQLGALGSLGGFQQGGNQAGLQALLQGAGQFGNLGLQDNAQQMNNIGQTFAMGQQQFQNSDLENQRRLQLLTGLLGSAQGASLNQPTQVTPSGFQQGANFGGQIGNAIAAYFQNQNKPKAG